MKKTLLLIGAVLAGMFTASISANAVSSGNPMIYVNGVNEITLTFPVAGGTKHIDVKNSDGGTFVTWLLPDFCEVRNVTSKGFDLYCSPNKTPVYRKDYFLVSDSEYENSATIYVRQESYAKPRKLIIDGKRNEEITARFDFSGGKEIFFVETDSPDYDFWGMPYFCSIESKTATSFFVVCSANDSAYERSDYFKVQAGELEVQINVVQAANPNGERYDYDGPEDGDYSGVDTYMGYPNIVDEPDTWLEVLGHMMENPVKRYDDGSCYKGLLNNEGLRNGYGVYYWPVKSYYFGEWEDGDRSGMGIYIIGDFSYQFSNCEDCVVYVGQFKNNMANGRGSCYDKYGNLIYDGDFVDGVPQDTYPNGDTFEAGYKFQIYHIQEGDLYRWYVGETYNTERHGWGVLIWDDYDACFGKWKEDARSDSEEQLFMTRNGRIIEMRQY